MSLKEKTNTSLYDLWDTGLTQFIRSENANFWESGWTNVNRGIRTPDGIWFNPKPTFDAENQEFTNAVKADPVNGYVPLFERWAKEAAVYACKEV